MTKKEIKLLEDFVYWIFENYYIEDNDPEVQIITPLDLLNQYLKEKENELA